MLAYFLALAVGIGSLAIYLIAFLFPKIHRKNDLIWSGVGLFYALVLWIFARKITGGLLLGHIASVSLLTWFGWQTMTLRQQVPATTQPATNGEILPGQSNLLQNLSQNLSQLTGGFTSVFTNFKSRGQKKPSQSQPQDTKRAETTPASVAVERLRTVQDESTPTESTTETATEGTANTQETKVVEGEQQTNLASSTVTGESSAPTTDPETEVINSDSDGENSNPVNEEENNPENPTNPPTTTSES